MPPRIVALFRAWRPVRGCVGRRWRGWHGAPSVPPTCRRRAVLVGALHVRPGVIRVIVRVMIVPSARPLLDAFALSMYAAILHPWQADPPLPSKVVIDISHHLPRDLPAPDGWSILQRNGRVWVAARRNTIIRLDAAHYGMLLATCYGQEADPNQEIPGAAQRIQ